MTKEAQQKQPDMIIRAPLTGSCLGLLVEEDAAAGEVLPWWAQGRSIIVPFTSVISIAPPTVTIVPTIFAWLWTLLRFTFSSLQQNQPSSTIYIEALARFRVL